MSGPSAIIMKPTPPTLKPMVASSSALSAAAFGGLSGLKGHAYGVGEREGMVAALREAFGSSKIVEDVVAAVRNAPTDDEAKARGCSLIRAEKDRLEAELADNLDDSARLRRLATAYKDMIARGGELTNLRSTTSSVFHKVYEEGVVMLTREAWDPPEEITAARHAAGVFLVEHDWAAVLDGAEVDAGPFRLPFDHCCFEFTFGRLRVCALFSCRDGEPYQFLPLMQTSVGWALQMTYVAREAEFEPALPAEREEAFRPFINEIIAQVRAIAITLDAEVVVAETVRAPHRLNRVREIRGVPPIFDHHTLRLSRKPRPGRLASPATSGHRRRLHFRRGHWRHYAEHKTWIRWMLVGDPSLGFADKDYRL